MEQEVFSGKTNETKVMRFLSGYKNLTVSRCGVMNVVGPRMGARFEVDQDLRPLFPYINASHEEAKYLETPEHIQFVFDNVLLTLYPFEIIAVAFADENEADLFGERLLAYLNEIHENRQAVKPDYKTIVPLSPIDIYQLLPGTNCGECGRESCLAFAAAVSKDKALPADCPGFAEPIVQKAVYPIFDKHGNLTSTVELSTTADKKHPAVPENLLTEREIDILRLLAKGFSNPEMAKLLSISPHTVKTHVTHIYDKLGVNDRAQAAVWAAGHDVI